MSASGVGAQGGSHLQENPNQGSDLEGALSLDVLAVPDGAHPAEGMGWGTWSAGGQGAGQGGPPGRHPPHPMRLPASRQLPPLSGNSRKVPMPGP